jgi:hypothetical protein
MQPYLDQSIMQPVGVKVTIRGGGELLLLKVQFTLFENFQVGEEDTVSIAFTLEGVAFFRAWLRSRGLDPALCSS